MMGDEKTVVIAKLAVTVLLGAFLVLRFIAAKGIGGEEWRKLFSQFRIPVLSVLTVAAIFSYIHLGEFHGDGEKIHHHEMYHLYLGSKYFEELGYFDLYDATAVAEFEDGNNLGGLPFIMNLRTYAFWPVEESLMRRDEIKAAFTEERWSSFKSDLSWFRSHMHWQSYALMLHDHGYNSTPAWTFVARPVANLVPVRMIGWLGALDGVLLAGAIAFVCFAFGLELGLIALIFVAVNPLSPFSYIGGSFLRHDWFLCSVGALCCLYRRWHLAAGLLLGYAFAMRLFPAAFLFGISIHGLALLVSEKRVAREHLILGGGFVASALFLFLLSLTLAGGVGNWRQFAQNMETHNQNIAINNLGLKKVIAMHEATLTEESFLLAYEGDYMKWNHEMQRRMERNRVHHYGIAALFVGLLGVACWRARDFVAYGLSTFLVFFLFLPSNYYYAFLVIPFLALLAEKERWQRLVSVLLLPGIFMAYFAMTLAGYFDFGKYVVLSVLMLAAAFLICLYEAIVREGKESPLDEAS